MGRQLSSEACITLRKEGLTKSAGSQGGCCVAGAGVVMDYAALVYGSSPKDRQNGESAVENTRFERNRRPAVICH